VAQQAKKTKKDELREYFEADLWEFAQYINPHYVYGDIHREVFRWLQYGDSENQLLLMPRGHLKALRLDQKVLTVDGWVETGELEEGDTLLGSDGLPQKLEKLHPISEMSIYEVEFADGRKVYCNEEHLWTLSCPSNTKDRLVTKPLKEIRKNYKAARYDKRSGEYYEECRYFLHPPLPVEHEEKDFAIDPYTLGVWLGDGHKGTNYFTTFDPEIINYIPYDVEKLNSGKGRYKIEGLRKKLQEANIVDNKEIPEKYLFGSVEQRLSLLQGLMDTDGTVHKKNNNQAFCTVLPKLRDQVVSLVRSLGGKATWCECETDYGTSKKFTAFFVNIWMPDGLVPFKLERKAQYVRTGQRLKTALKNIKYVGEDKARCITVSNNDGLFITEDYVLTHNSHMIAVWAVWQITRDPTTTMVYLSAGEDLAKIQVYSIKNMLTCDNYRRLWPEMVNQDEGRREKWSAFEINVDHPKRREMGVRDSTIIVKTVRSNATGLHCSHLVFDDIVVPQNAYTETGRKEVAQSVSQFSSIKNPEATTKAVGTRYHPRDIYQAFREAFYPIWDEDTGEMQEELPLWDVKEYVLEDAGDGSGEYLWPRTKHPHTGRWEGFNRQIRDKKLAEYSAAGERDQFWSQYYNNPNSTDSQRIDRSKFQYIDRKHLVLDAGKWYYKGAKLNIVAAMDVAWTVNKRSDYTALAVVGKDIEGYVYVLDLDQFKAEGTDYETYYRRIVALQEKWQFKKMKIESNAAGKLIAEEIKDRIRKNNNFLAIETKAKTKHDEGKIERAEATLIPLYINESVFHTKGGFIQEYEEQVILERPPHDDLRDAVCTAVEIVKTPKKREEREHNVIPFKVASGRFGGIRA